MKQNQASSRKMTLMSITAVATMTSMLLGAANAPAAFAAGSTNASSASNSTNSSANNSANNVTLGSATRRQIESETQAGAKWLIANGGTANQDWAAVAAYAASVPVSVPQLSASKMTAEIPKLKATTDYARFILALLAEGQDPHQFAARNFVAALAKAQIQNGPDAGKFADNIDGTGTDLINSQAWAIIALEDAGGVTYNRSAAAKWLISQQNKDGGFGYSHKYSTSDADDTASAVVALTLLGYGTNSTPVAHALAYLKTQQTSDGGFKNGASTSNADSTGVVTDALEAAGINPLSWTQKNGNPISALLKFYDAKSGGFNYDNTGQSWSGVSAFSTRDAVLGLAAFLSGHSIYQRLHFTTFTYLNPYWQHVHQQNGLWLWHHWYSWQKIRPMAIAGSYSYDLTPEWQTVIKNHGKKENGGFEFWDIHLATEALAARYGWDSLHLNGIS